MKTITFWDSLRQIQEQAFGVYALFWSFMFFWGIAKNIIEIELLLLPSIIAIIIAFAAKIVGFEPSQFGRKRTAVIDNDGSILFFLKSGGIPALLLVMSFASGLYLSSFFVDNIRIFINDQLYFSERLNFIIFLFFVFTFMIGLAGIIVNRLPNIRNIHFERGVIYTINLFMIPLLLLVFFALYLLLNAYESVDYNSLVIRFVNIFVGYTPLIWIFELLLRPLLKKAV